jgi:predicted acylesterase/phospholipase RssA
MPLYKNLVVRPVLTPAQKAKARITEILREKMLVDGVFEGGGALGAAYVGALRVLHDNGVWFARVAGNSAGAITASMVAAGFSAPEIQWLSSGFADRPPAPQSLTDAGITAPIDFSSFLDLPGLSSISQPNKRKTLLWKALNASVLDELGKIALPVPTQASAVDACVTGIMQTPLLGDAIRAIPGTTAQTVLRTTLDAALTPLPNGQLHVSDFLPNTTNLRRALADTLWDAIARNIPLMLMTTNLVHEGSIFEGDVFYSTLKRLFGLKVHRNATATVLFKDLKIPLAVIAANIDSARMEIYDSRNDSNMEVALAVRRSMSIPFIFEPQGGQRQIVDGGLFSNFPVWLYSAAGSTHWPATSIDDRRVKVGFSLDDFGRPPDAWNVRPAKFVVSGDPPRVDQKEVLRPLLEEKLVDLGYPQAAVALQLSEALGNDSGSANQKPEIEILQQIFGVAFRGILNTEAATRKVLTEGLMKGRPYIDVAIPLLGYDALDFYVNGDEGDLTAMWDRGWHTAVGGFLNAKQRGLLPTVMTMSKIESPFN